MKKFDGIYKYAYQTIFGIVNIESSADGRFLVRQVTDTLIRLPVIVSNNCTIGFRVFNNRTKAYLYMKDLERIAKEKISTIYAEI